MAKQNILRYESDVWRTADLLIGAGIKQSDFPKFMMPFFALVMVESRLVRYAEQLEKELSKDEDLEGFIEEFQDLGLGYNDYVIREGKTLKSITKNDKTFDVDFHSYLRSFDPGTKNLLGVDKGTEEAKFLDISGVSGQLKKKDILFATVQAWSEIDLTGFDNSEITTLEEHIKRKWADISAETAGEQYTPDDIISLISEIITSKLEDNGKFLTIYDPTCGGGNLLFGVEDKIQKQFTSRPTATYGQEWSDSLYALAAIESRFRKDSQIKYGNTLTGRHFDDKEFDVIVANPPYGVDWKGYKKNIQNDQTGRFHDLPSISDGQFLFTQHIISYLGDAGIAVVVHNGSTLFSGDAGSGESNIRKYFFDKDWVEAIIQMPTDEFFNTGIYTYLWVFNKQKPAERKDRVMLINASTLFKPLKKSRGKKRKEMVAENRQVIVESLAQFENSDIAKVYDKWHFYYNKQSILLQNLDQDGESYQPYLEWKESRFEPGEMYQVKANKIKPKRILQNGASVEQMVITTFDQGKYDSLKEYHNQELKAQLKAFDFAAGGLVVEVGKDCFYTFDTDRNTIIFNSNGKEEARGCGKILVKSTFKAETTKKKARIEIFVELTADNQKDYEIIPYSPDPAKNEEHIADFMTKYITKPFEYLGNVIGVEVNFNKEFYKPITLRSVEVITGELAELEKELKELENSLAL